MCQGLRNVIVGPVDIVVFLRRMALVSRVGLEMYLLVKVRLLTLVKTLYSQFKTCCWTGMVSWCCPF
jgi:hypothetical protein